MSGSREKWIDRWWPALVITFGLVCMAAVDFFKPSY